MNIGPLEIMMILLIALVVVGPSRLPEVGRSIGKGLREFRKVQDEVRDSINFNLDEPIRPPTPARTPRAPRTPERPAPAPPGDDDPVPAPAPAAGSVTEAADPVSEATIKELVSGMNKGLTVEGRVGPLRRTLLITHRQRQKGRSASLSNFGSACRVESTTRTM